MADKPDPFLTDWRCPNPECRQMMVDISQEWDTMQVLLCTTLDCPNVELWTVVKDELTPFCPLHLVPESQCSCPKPEVK
jgi:hypothetical protein